MERPSIRSLPAPLLAASRGIAERLAEIGHRGWIVGGAVRDLALGRMPKELDMASAATPDEVEGLFPRTLSVGRAFGTMLIDWRGTEVQLTTFRSESGYRDARRPDRVEFGASAEEDATRRDFTCNALFLDPLGDAFLDPTGGLADLERGILRAVGDPSERFAEDGLRLLRMARFSACLGLEPTPEVLAAARACAGALRGVSPERILAELTAIFDRRNASRAIELLAETGLIGPVLRIEADPAEAGDVKRRVLDLLPQPPGILLGLAVLLDAGAGSGLTLERAQEMRLSAALRTGLGDMWQLRAAIEALGPSASRADRIRLVRHREFSRALALTRAWRSAKGERCEDLAALEALQASASASDLFPEPLVTSADLAAAGVERGPEWGAILRDAETAQLDGRFADRRAALDWLAARVRRAAGPHDGGKTSRSARDT